MATPDGIRDLQSIAAPLLLNLEPGAFNETMSILQPQKIRAASARFAIGSIDCTSTSKRARPGQSSNSHLIRSG